MVSSYAFLPLQRARVFNHFVLNVPMQEDLLGASSNGFNEIHRRSD